MSKHIFFLILFLCFASWSVMSQSTLKRERKEILFGFGATNFLGDLGGSPRIGSEPFSMRDLNWSSTRPLAHIGYRYRISQKSSYKATFTFGYLYGNDNYTENQIRYNRNINFRAPIWELQAQYEYFIFLKEREGHRYFREELKGWKVISDKIYLFAGAGVLVFIPQGQYTNGAWHNLRPLSTEGQGMVETRKKYSLIQPVIHFGIGFKYSLNWKWAIGLEYSIRKTFTDYIDDTSTTYFNNDNIRDLKGDVAAYFADPSRGLVPGQTIPGAQRGDPKDKDSYMFANLTFYYKFKKHKTNIPRF
jgi:hypothetical protein